jgi:hypothetical protein
MKKNYIIFSISSLPMFIFLYYLPLKIVNFKLLFLVIPSCIGLFGGLFLLSFLHNRRTKNKTGPKNFSLYLALFTTICLIIYFYIDLYSSFHYNRPGSALNAIGFIVLPFVICTLTYAGYIFGLIIEYLIRHRNPLYKAEDITFFEHLKKYKILYSVVLAVVLLKIIYFVGFNFARSKGILPVFDVHYAACKGYISQVERVISANPSQIEAKDSSGGTLLHSAAVCGQSKMIEFLMSKGADINSRDTIEQTPLHKAAWYGDVETVAVLLKYGAMINAQDKAGETPLFRTVKKGHADIVEELIKNGADINIKNNGNQTAIFYAVSYGYEDIVKILLDNGAQIDFYDTKGRSPLSVSIENKYQNIERMLRCHTKK